ncbi:hypothetical protein [Chlorogloea sp. CCALA 695]|uniref:hypothetical protein n=1 Tax=Chlorogloea sp. CCALA 695 TaxID=2107693 RepID=UPI000D07D4F0|nr:hypothetical protein [Chlorogloea sp. CCALA 695]PSB26933.1 hypothetical protein C7B70_23270 [Chlorogloea sp. CCALA 695]
MVATTVQETVPTYFPDSLDLPLPLEHKTWHTERLCPPLLAQALGSERQAMFIAQLHYWLQKDNVGVNRHGFHWIYNTEWEWREQFPWMSEHTIGRIRRKLEQLGYVVSNDFNRNPLDRTKHSTLDYYRIALETGWNPLGLDLKRNYNSPPQFIKGIRLRGRHKSDTTPLVHKPVDLDESKIPKPAKLADSAKVQNASCTFATMHSALLPLSSIYKDIPYISKSNPETDLKIELLKADKEVGGEELLGKEEAISFELTDKQETVSLELTEFSSIAQETPPPSPDNDEDIKATQQSLAVLNARAEIAERHRTNEGVRGLPIRISGVDELTHEILWKHQEQLEKLNADLRAPRIKTAIADNPQHLEDAIKAFYENSANGAKTQADATGFLYNALRHGWKPRQSGRSAEVQVYTPPPQMLEEHKPGTLEQLIERKRLMWQNAPLLRSLIEAWIEQTPGVIRTDDGPALADATAQPSHQDLELKAGSHQVTSTTADTRSLAENAASPPLEQRTLSEVEPHQVFNSALPQKKVPLANLAASNPTVPLLETTADSAAVELPAKESASTSPLPQQKQPNHRRLQPVEILNSAGDWVKGYFIHQCIAIANVVGLEQKFTLFDADGGAYTFLGQVRPL